MSSWKLTVGMEVHVELETKTKLFCGCPNDPFHSEPNTNVCPVCYGLPGALPVLNKAAVEMTVKLGRALKGKIAKDTFWARKNYFYPDLPKGYQISQSTAPLVEDAVVVIDGHDHHIERIHLEEDAGKLTHAQDKSHSLVNYNRAGVPLMEIVTQPDFNSAESAKRFCQELQRILRSLKISSADMEKGLMRCEANISVAKEGDSAFGTKVEVKNINSFKAVEKAIKYEFDRQTKALEAGEVISQETRTWDESGAKTVVMRSKETSADYRYFPEPDLPAVAISEPSSEEVHHLPEDMRRKLVDIGLSEEMARVMVDQGHYQSLMNLNDSGQGLAVASANLAQTFPSFFEMPPSEQVSLLEEKKKRGLANSKLEEVMVAVLEEGRTVADFFSDSQDLSVNDVVLEVIEENQKIVSDFKAGNLNALNALVGKVMAKTKGSVNVAEARSELERQLS